VKVKTQQPLYSQDFYQHLHIYHKTHCGKAKLFLVLII
jgi:hypothetical protein